jgi:hypothetical protein
VHHLTREWPNHIDANGVEYWENLMFSQIREAEIQLGVSVVTS